MKSSNELLKGMQPGDYVLVKTLGQLVDTEGLSIDMVWFVKNKDVMGVLGKMLPIDSVSVIDGVPFATVSYNNKQYTFGEEMFFQLYPLTRGLI